MSYEISQRFFFDAAHTLRREIEAEGSKRVHGHTYYAEVFVRGEPQGQSGMVLDLGYIRREVEVLREKLDHHFLDEVPGLGIPKDQAEVVLTRGNELKLVYPQPDVDPARFAGLAFEHFFLQPMDGPERIDRLAPRARHVLGHLSDAQGGVRGRQDRVGRRRRRPGR